MAISAAIEAGFPGKLMRFEANKSSDLNLPLDIDRPHLDSVALQFKSPFVAGRPR